MEIIGIISALEIEIAAIKEKVSNVKTKTIAKHVFYEGELDNNKIVFVDSGVGKVNAALITQAIIDHYLVKYIINTGIAGGLDPSLKHKSIVLGEELTYHDFSLEFLKKFFPYKQSFHSDRELIEKMQRLFPDKELRRGKIVTGDLFITETAKQIQLREDFKATCVEMEGAAIAHVCDANDIPFLSIRSISDFADDDGAEDYDTFEEEAARLAAEIVVKFVKEI